MKDTMEAVRAKSDQLNRIDTLIDWGIGFTVTLGLLMTAYLSKEWYLDAQQDISRFNLPVYAMGLLALGIALLILISIASIVGMCFLDQQRAALQKRRDKILQKKE